MKSIRIDETQIVSPACQKAASARCRMDCTDDTLMELATTPKYNVQSIFELSEFWKFFIVLSVFWISQAIIWNLQDPICFDLLGRYLIFYNK